jgi:hypothetical protein
VADLTPNDLLLTLVKALQAQPAQNQPAGFEAPAAPLPAAAQFAANDQQALGRALASLPDLVTFAGYLGGVVDDTAGTTLKEWAVLYLDTKFSSWLLVETGGIVYRKRVLDPSGGSRDVLWVRADASVGRGRGAQTNQERFLRGDFTAAGDVTVTPTGGTSPAATGLLVDATTPGCCGFKSR